MELVPGPRRPAVVATVDSLGSPPDWPAPVPPHVRDESTQSVDWRRIGSALWRARHVILLITALGTLAGVWARRFGRVQYVARATVWIDEGQHREATLGPIRSERLFDPEAWVDLIQSDAVLVPAVRDAGLLVQAGSPADSAALAGLSLDSSYRAGQYQIAVAPGGGAWRLSTQDGALVEAGAEGDSVGRRIGLHWLPDAATLVAASPVSFALLSEHDAARQLAARLQVKTDVNGNILTVELQGADPKRLAATVNAVAEHYVETATGLQQQKLTELAGLLENQRQQAEQQLHQAESDLQRFRVNTITLPTLADAGRAGGADPGGRDPAMASFLASQTEQQSLQRDRAAIADALARASPSGVSAEALMGIGAVQHSAELSAELRELTDREAELRAIQFRYGETYPTVQRLTEEIAALRQRTIPAGLRALLDQIGISSAQLARTVDATSSQLRAIPARALEQSRLERSVTLASALYTDLQQRTDEARLAKASSVPEVRVLDRAAQPHLPVRDTTNRIVLMAFAASFGLSIVGVLVVDRVDPRIRHPRQVTEEIGVPIIGVLPHCTRYSPFQMIGRIPRDMASLIEAVRAACCTLSEVHGPQRPVIVTLTSPGPGEGKSFVCANLAMAFAYGGVRTLVIDADMRRGVQHRTLGTDRRPGLGDYLRGAAPLDSVVLTTGHPQLGLIPCGGRDRNPPGLLAAPAFASLLDACSKEFAVILVDSPPLAAGVDPMLLAKATGCLLLVLRTGRSNLEVTRTKLGVMSRFSTRLLGAILNDARPSPEYLPHAYSLPGYEATGERGIAALRGGRS